jgi:hypothetical protein
MDTDHNLLFGVLALQADLLDNDPFAAACSAWAARKGTPLTQASNRWEAVTEESCVNVGRSASTIQMSENIVVHIGEPLLPGGWKPRSRVEGTSFLFIPPGLRRYMNSCSDFLTKFRFGNRGTCGKRLLNRVA